MRYQKDMALIAFSADVLEWLIDIVLTVLGSIVAVFAQAVLDKVIKKRSSFTLVNASLDRCKKYNGDLNI